MNKSASPYKLISASGTNATAVKAAGTRLFSYDIANTNGAARFVKLYNKPTAPNLGTDTPVMTIAVPGNSRSALAFSGAALFPLGLGLAITGAVSDTDTTAVGAGDVVVNLLLA